MRNRDDVELPKWLADVLPEPKRPVILDYADDKYIVSHPDAASNGKIGIFDDLEEAYDYARSFGIGERATLNFTEKHPDPFLSVPCKDSNNTRLLLIRDDDDEVSYIKSEFADFMKVAETYRNNPQDFMNAYKYVHGHPCFWTRNSTDDNAHWDFTATSFWIHPFKNNTGDIGWWIEAGAHVEPDYTSHYHDLRLDVEAPTLEEAYIKLAEKIDKFFNDDGSEKENVEYEKSGLELLLESRMNDIYGDDDSDDEDENSTQSE